MMVPGQGRVIPATAPLFCMASAHACVAALADGCPVMALPGRAEFRSDPCGGKKAVALSLAARVGVP